MIYFIQGEQTKRIKIGRTDNLVRRLGEFQPYSADKLIVLAVILDEDDDHVYHPRFKASWSHGEWFNPSPELMAFIESLLPSEYDGLSLQIGNSWIGPRSKLDAKWAAKRRRVRPTLAAANADRYLTKIEQYSQDPEMLREAAILRASIDAARKSPAELRAEVEAILQKPFAPQTIERLRAEFAADLLREGEIEEAHAVITGRDDAYVKDYMLGDGTLRPA